MNNDIIVYKLGGTSQCINGYDNLCKEIYNKTNTKIIIILSV